MKKVLIVKSSAKAAGGAEKVARLLAESFAEAGCQVALVSGEASRLPLFSFQRVRQFDRLAQEIVLRESPDLVLSLDRTSKQTHLRASNGVHAAYLERRKEWEGGWKASFFSLNPLHRTLLKIERESFCDPHLKRLFVNSEMVRGEILAHYPVVDAGKICVVHNAVEWALLEEPFHHWPLVKPVNDEHQLLFAGHNYQRKGLGFLLKALSTYHKTGWKLTVVGKESSLSSWRRLASRLGIAEKVHFAGEQKSLISFYQQTDTLVVPSLYDPFANVTVEALAMGNFVISSPHNGGKEVLLPYSGAVLKRLDDSASWHCCLDQALAHPKTEESAQQIRDSVAHLELKLQLPRLVEPCLKDLACC